MKQSVKNIFIIFFLFCGSSAVIFSAPRFLTEDHYRNRIIEYLHAVNPTYVPFYIDFEKLTNYLRTRVDCADKAARGGVFVKQIEAIALAPFDDQFLHLHPNKRMKLFFPRMVQEHVDFYVKEGAGKGSIFSKDQKVDLLIEASKEFATKILDVVDNNKAKL